MSEEILSFKSESYMKTAYILVMVSLVVGILMLPFSLFFSSQVDVAVDMPSISGEYENAGDAQKAALEYIKSMEKIAVKAQSQSGFTSFITTIQSIAGTIGFCGWVMSLLAVFVFKDKLNAFGMSHMRFVAAFFIITFLVSLVLSLFLAVPFLGDLILVITLLGTTFLFYVAFDMFKQEKAWDMDGYKIAVREKADMIKAKFNKENTE